MMATQIALVLSIGVLTTCARAGDAPAPVAVSRCEPAVRSTDKIDLALADADIYEALGMLAMKARINVFADADLNGRVTIDVRSAPWDEKYELRIVQVGNEFWIAAK